MITRNLPPLVGGMERLNWHMADELSRHAEVRVIGPQGATASAPQNVHVTEVPLRPLWKFLALAKWRALREARRWRPDLVLAGSGLTAPATLMAARASGASAAVYVHGLDLSVRHPLYKQLWLPALRRMDRVIANSQPTRQLAEQVGIDPERIGIVHPGVDLPTAAHDPGGAERFRAEHQLGDRPLLLSVGRLSTRKGLREFVTQALPRIAAEHPEATLLVVGDAPHNALRAQAQTPDSIREAAQHAGVGNNLRFLGTITDYTELGVVYRTADVHVFPVRNIPGDPEGFGMVAVEAAAHGLPTVAFAAGGVVDAVADGQSGRLVASGDYPALAEAVLQTLAARDALRPDCHAFARRFAWPEFASRLVAQLSRIAPGLSAPRVDA